MTLAAQLANAFVNAEIKKTYLIKKIKIRSKTILGIAGAPGIALSEIVVYQPKVELSTLALQKVSLVQQDKEVKRFKKKL